MVQKLDMSTPDFVNENLEKLAVLFPNCVAEGIDGKAIDFDLLKQELSYATIEGTKERYRLEWPGKRESIVKANIPTNNTLRPIRKESVDFDKTENLYIEGDNLEVLKLLQESYLGKVKLIYIDPPYNTGKDFVYKDSFKQDSEEYNADSGQIDEYNQRLVANPETSGRYHSHWLSMMYPRLKLARNLMTEDGVIFISIDDNEAHNLKKIGEEIFGENNFIGNVIWERAFSPKNDAKYFSDSHDHILVFSKSISEFDIGKLERSEEANSRYKNIDDDPRGPWTSSDLTVKTYNVAYDFEIETPSGRKVSPTDGRCWNTNRERIKELIEDNRLWFGKEGNNMPRFKRFLSEVQTGMVPVTIWPYKEVGHNQEGRQEVKKLFDDKGYFDGPKPIRLLSRILTVANLDRDSIVLDFFSGSATTAHAVLQLNAEDGGTRKFIQVQLPEATDEKSEAFKAGYKNICEIGKERIRRAAKKIKEETGADIDYGFRVYRLDESNMQDVYYKPQEYQQANLDLFADNVKPDRNADDLLAQVMLDWGLPLSLPIEQENIKDKQVFKVAGNSLFACFDKGIDEDFAKEIAKETPLRIVFRDNGFKDDTAKVNVKQLLKQLSPETEMKVI